MTDAYTSLRIQGPDLLERSLTHIGKYKGEQSGVTQGRARLEQCRNNTDSVIAAYAILSVAVRKTKTRTMRLHLGISTCYLTDRSRGHSRRGVFDEKMSQWGTPTVFEVVIQIGDLSLARECEC